ncbi:beta-lactamase class A [Cerasibacillus quisquiliarum]|uniref:Serine hydrolase n=1 Tax=Cerasibacillus quisquiliarum TaxID=227865 RepID=A0A511V2E8_9BACI|nr:serine hydrolase [Cerasibacillus quisquiliarum]MBB5147094.1 beta-lactamase class A [Cerasibacillus quisquiliarum]GEN32058.1 serine hydrolase [Cerasibacillus quisquiliarum]
MKTLIQQIEKTITDSNGEWGVVLEDLQTKETWTYNEHEQFPAASIIKLPIMVAAFQAAEDKILRLSDTYSLSHDDLVGGSGVLQHMTPGTNITIHDLITLMIIQSDNTATNILIDLLEVDYIQKIMEDIGMHESEFYNKLMIVPVKRKGANTITAKDVSHLLKQLVQGALVSEHACEQMIEIMKKQQISDGFRGKLPSQQTESIIGAMPQWQLANKTGHITNVQHDAGIFYVGYRQLIATVLIKNLEDYKANTSLMQLGETIYQYLRA